MTRLAWITGLLIFPSPLLFADDAKIDPFFTPRPELRAAAKDDPQHSPNFFRLRGRDFKNLVTSKKILSSSAWAWEGRGARARNVPKLGRRRNPSLLD